MKWFRPINFKRVGAPLPRRAAAQQRRLYQVRAFSKILVVVAALAAFAPSPLLACAACYGRSDSPLAYGMNWGIFTLLGVVLTVLSCFALFFVHVMRGERTNAEDPENPTPEPPTDV
jgi:hypothetical protein